ncbi:MAG: sigma-70 family RNA polymerase sigma factor [Clostridiaceae bacterium]|nr:sigma-70 family RNA polymerase sigma factor [Clostridiaceae bacterium]
MNFLKNTKVKLAIRGDKNAFVDLINDNRLSLYRVSKGILGRDDQVEDAIQNTILKAYEGINTLKKSGYFKTWLIRILINECNSISRKNKKVVYLEESTITGKYEDNYKDIDLTRAINSLDDNLRQVVILYYFEDMPQKEIAKLLNINETTVRTRLVRARNKLFQLLKSDYREDVNNE